MDPLGFALENFDALGQVAHGERRRADRRLRRRCPTAAGFRASPACATLLLSHRDDFVRTFTEKLLAYAIGRGIEPDDLPAVRKIARDAAAQDYRWSAIILGIVRSTPFR